MTSSERLDGHVKPAPPAPGDEPKIAKVLTIFVGAGCLLSGPLAVLFLQRVADILESFAVVPKQPLALCLDVGGYTVGAFVGLVGMIPIAVYAFCQSPRIRIVASGLCGVLASLFWMTLNSSFQATMADILNALK